MVFVVIWRYGGGNKKGGGGGETKRNARVGASREGHGECDLNVKTQVLNHVQFTFIFAPRSQSFLCINPNPRLCSQSRVAGRLFLFSFFFFFPPFSLFPLQNLLSPPTPSETIFCPPAMLYLARSVARKALSPAVARPAVAIARRGFAEAVPADKLRLSLALPHEVRSAMPSFSFFPIANSLLYRPSTRTLTCMFDCSFCGIGRVLLLDAPQHFVDSLFLLLVQFVF